MSFAVGDKVRLIVPDNARLHGTEATVRELTDWGAHVLAPAAGSGQFRAFWWEMERLGSVNHAVLAEQAADYDQWLNSPAKQNGQALMRQQGVPLVLASDGSVCVCCGGINMIQAGACKTCADCGTSGGCG
jgi:hypothetical protein